MQGPRNGVRKDGGEIRRNIVAVRLTEREKLAVNTVAQNTELKHLFSSGQTRLRRHRPISARREPIHNYRNTFRLTRKSHVCQSMSRAAVSDKPAFGTAQGRSRVRSRLPNLAYSPKSY